ncbi:unnamed protein product [Ectocarpus sp. 6 AP-2014]
MIKLSDDAVSEVRSMVLSNDSRVFRFLRLYMMGKNNNNICEVLDSKEYLTKPVVHTAWETGRDDILRNCVRNGVPIDAKKSLAPAIRSGSVETLDFCVEQGGSIQDMTRPYCHCTTTEMMEHIWEKYKKKLYDREAVFPRDLRFSVKYMEMGGTVAQMGKDMNDYCHREGNWSRSLPIKRAYMEETGPYESTLASVLLSLPKSVVNLVCEFM